MTYNCYSPGKTNDKIKPLGLITEHGSLIKGDIIMSPVSVSELSPLSIMSSNDEWHLIDYMSFTDMSEMHGYVNCIFTNTRNTTEDGRFVTYDIDDVLSKSEYGKLILDTKAGKYFYSKDGAYRESVKAHGKEFSIVSDKWSNNGLNNALFIRGDVDYNGFYLPVCIEPNGLGDSVNMFWNKSDKIVMFVVLDKSGTASYFLIHGEYYDEVSDGMSLREISYHIQNMNYIIVKSGRGIRVWIGDREFLSYNQGPIKKGSTFTLFGNTTHENEGIQL